MELYTRMRRLLTTSHDTARVADLRRIIRAATADKVGDKEIQQWNVKKFKSLLTPLCTELTNTAGFDYTLITAYCGGPLQGGTTQGWQTIPMPTCTATL